MTSYPVTYQQTAAVERNRLTVFFRFFTAIPHLIWNWLYSIAAMVAVFFAWFAIVVTGHYPEAIYNFVAGYLRFNARLLAYMYLVADVYPPFDGGEHPEYPARTSIPPSQKSYSRITTFFRFFFLIPVMFLLWVFSLWIMAVAIALWFVAVITGKTSPDLVNAERFPLAYFIRAYAYAFLLTDRWPALED